VPAISAVSLPEGGKLEPRRTDKDFFSGDIKQEMFQYLEYSRFALADISGLNFNVAYELGARHRAREYGTAIFRQTQFSPPFDISSIKAFPYKFEPADKAAEARIDYARVDRVARPKQARQPGAARPRRATCIRQNRRATCAGRKRDQTIQLDRCNGFLSASGRGPSVIRFRG
jgi:hypothetical protein